MRRRNIRRIIRRKKKKRKKKKKKKKKKTKKKRKKKKKEEKKKEEKKKQVNLSEKRPATKSDAEVGQEEHILSDVFILQFAYPTITASLLAVTQLLKNC